MMWGMFMSATMESAVFMGKNLVNNCHSIAFDISARMVSEQDEISGMETIGWENHTWKYLSLIGEERIINLQRTKVYVFSDSVLCLGKIFEKPPIKRCMGTKIGMVQIISGIQKLWQNRRRADGLRVEHFPKDSIRCSSVTKTKVYC